VTLGKADQYDARHCASTSVPGTVGRVRTGQASEQAPVHSA
jgi:hypothetical protein